MTIATRGQGLASDTPESQGISSVAGTSDEEVLDENAEPEFPHDKLASLDEKISNLRWVVPVLPDQELECLLKVSIELARKNLDTRSEACQRFFREGLTTSFTKILTDDAVSSWKANIHMCINHNCQRLVELCVLKLPYDWYPLLDLLAMVFNPNNKFHSFNAQRPSETAGPGTSLSEEDLYARPSNDLRNPRGWLVDLINRFGELGGFQLLLDRFQSGKNLTVSVVFALLRPFGLAYEYLTPHTINKYILPILEMVPGILEKLTDDELKREAKNESKSDIVSAIIKSAKNLASRVQNQEELIRTLESFRLTMILRQLQISSFNGKMNALNEINKVISSVTYYPNRHHDDDEYLTPERMAKWITDNHVLEIVLRDSLHQPQYVEKLEKILRFVIKERALSLSDLDAVWAAQAGKHEAIVKNVHDLLAKLAWDFSAEQLDHLFECFQSSWTSASKRQRERLLELIRRLAEDDKDGVMAHKVLTLFWNLAHAEDVTTEIMDQALAAHVKILDYSCSQERDAQKTVWLDKCVDELKSGNNWDLPALKQIREICCLYEPNTNGVHSQRTQHMYYRQEVIERLQHQHSLVILVANSLTHYMDQLRVLVKENPELTSENYLPDKRYCHALQVQERLNFLRFLLKDGQLWLCAEQAKQIWQCLAENAVFASDREACFKWFSKLMGDEPDLDPGINKDFFENNILQLDPTLLTESGIKCFERFFKAVNIKEGKLKMKWRVTLIEDLDLIGLDYLWKVLTVCSDDIASRAIELLKEVTTNLGPSLQPSQMEFHETLITECYDRLKAHYDTVTVLQGSENDKEFDINQLQNKIRSEAVKMCRVMRVLQEYLTECDMGFVGERKVLPLYRAWRGKHISVIIRFSSPNRQVDDLEMLTHSNDTLSGLRRQILRRLKPGMHCKLELFVNGESLDTADDRKLLSQIPIRDKMIISAKITQVNSNIASSQDSSSDSSTSSPQHPYDVPDVEAENLLPTVIMSKESVYAEFFCRLSALGSKLEFPPLRDGARALLQLMPCDNSTLNRLTLLFTNNNDNDSIDNAFFSTTPAEVLYNLEVLYCMLMPALDPLSETTYQFQHSFMVSGEAHVFLEMLTKNNFMSSADTVTRRSAYLVVLKICKLILVSVAHVLVCLSEEHSPPEEEGNDDSVVTPGAHLRQALRSVPGYGDTILRQVSVKLSQCLAELMLAENTTTGQAQALFSQALNWELPDTPTVLALVRLVWAASSANLHAFNASQETLHSLCDPAKRNAPLELHNDDIALCKETLELLTIAVVLNPSSLKTLCEDKMFTSFVTDLVLLNPSRPVRLAAAEQFSLICTCGASSRLAMSTVIPLLFSLLETSVLENANNSHELFQLLCRLVSMAYVTGCPLVNAEALLINEVVWLRKARGQHDVLIEGHLLLARELLSFMSQEQKCELGGTNFLNFIKELLEDFLFPASKLMLQLNRTGQLGEDPAIPICDTPQTQAAAFDLLSSLCNNCVPNYRELVEMLSNMFYLDQESAILEWDYLPAVGPRPFQGFVGLKNAGATCYMNSVLQQLYMVESIREGILAAEGAATDPNEDFSGEERLELETILDDRSALEDGRKDYNVGILKQVQAIFGHLACSRLQYYVPRGLWRHFKLQGEPVNLREQQDAVEFFMSLVESLDEALKTLGHEQIMSKILGGVYSDQKICKGCPHRYSKEEPFSVISVDIRNHSNLMDSMEQYVKGELLEGADAYHCEKCSKKVVTVKRLCVKKLPPVLAIQLKRFEYDFERVCAIKFNDYFEFPRDLDMEPYTVSGLAKLEGEIIDCDLDPSAQGICTKYRLSGIVVHSGQASGGHYYSYIRHRDPSGEVRWYKFDDGDVSDCRMGEDEEMKVQCFGGDYMGEVFDPMLKRTTYRRQKRWWNAYMLFYTRQDVEENAIVKSLEELALSDRKEVRLKMPLAIENSIRKQNIKFLHHRSQFTIEYFNFIKKLANATIPPSSRLNQQLSPQEQEQYMLSVQLVSRFLFHTGWHTKKNLRGPAHEWCDVLCLHFRASPAIRLWFAHNMLFSHMHRFCEYLLSCPSNEVRSAFVKLVVYLMHFSINDGPSPCPAGVSNVDPNGSLSDHLLVALLGLLQREVSEHGRHFPQYCALFHMYATQGVQERAQLLRLNVPATFMLVALDEGPGPAIKYQYTELGKLNQLVSVLVRCCDVSSKCQSSTGGPVLPNPYRDPACSDYIMPLPPQACEVLFGRPSYIKKVIEDSNLTEDSIKLLQYCSWENPHFSRIVLSELLWQIAFAYCQELRHHMELLLSVLLIEDSWQTHRIHNALKGVSEERDGLLETINRSRNHYQKRAYQCIKCMVALFSKCRAAQAMLHNHADLRRQWHQAVMWLQDELERRYQANAQYSYNTWSSPTQSNESSNGYFLERSNSARKTLELAVELLPEPEKDEEEGGSEGQESQEEVGETSQGEEQRGDVPDVAQSEFF